MEKEPFNISGNNLGMPHNWMSNSTFKVKVMINNDEASRNTNGPQQRRLLFTSNRYIARISLPKSRTSP